MSKENCRSRKMYLKDILDTIGLSRVLSWMRYLIYGSLVIMMFLYDIFKLKLKVFIVYLWTDIQYFFFGEEYTARPYDESENLRPALPDGKDNNKELTKQIAMDCEMVGIGDGTESMLARISLVNCHGTCIYDKYVKPTEKIFDYRTTVSGIRPHHLRDGEDFKVVQSEVAEILRGRLLVGHALKHDLNVLFLSHPKKFVRDTSRYRPFKRITMGNTPSLKKLTAELLGVKIQTGEHNSVEDARAAMQLYMLYKTQWEKDVRRR